MPDYSNFLKLFQFFKAPEEEKRLLKKRSIIETVIGKFKNFFDATLSRFRSTQAAFFAICAGVLAVNFHL
jgi:hypothetical protein